MKSPISPFSLRRMVSWDVLFDDGSGNKVVMRSFNPTTSQNPQEAAEAYAKTQDELMEGSGYKPATGPKKRLSPLSEDAKSKILSLWGRPEPKPTDESMATYAGCEVRQVRYFLKNKR